jgi:hypothetical protein
MLQYNNLTQENSKQTSFKFKNSSGILIFHVIIEHFQFVKYFSQNVLHKSII